MAVHDDVHGDVHGDVEAEILDHAVLDSLRKMGGDAFLRELLCEFVASMDAYIPTLRQAAARGDADAVARSAHAFRSSSASMGAKQLSEMAMRIELAGRSGTLEGIPEAIEVLADHYKQAAAALHDAIH